MRIAIDAMGGDHAPDAVVKGAIEAAEAWPDATIVLVGDEAKIRPLLGSAPATLEVRHADDVIGPDEEPVRAVRRKKGSSMVVAGTLVREGEADAMISAGNTGALMATGLLILGRIDGIERPALAPMMPTLDNVGLLALDLGANMDAKPEHLLQYGLMGSIYRQKVHGLAKPRVGLLNVGTEEKKGNELTKAAYDLLAAAPIDFVGNVEARDVLTRGCDVLVCDGFVGNILLKAMEGTAGTVFGVLKEQFSKNLLTKLAAMIMLPGLRDFRRKMDYKEHGAAPLLGVNGLVLKSHGSSDAVAVKNAVRQARAAVEGRLIQAITSEISGKRE
ncbi:phosphate acyltransferase PlsX [Paenibacillus daejeonensis]|uniref:phosphate acyltransferase PlsX n=1 Tax=Paenibacillus daejeonensis TaxID=135193 RepID=UPI000476498D|nr:phosphate acyltransferase PlsX [Paenibacillus daejeonensis]